jgi:hypothetical protein
MMVAPKRSIRLDLDPVDFGAVEDAAARLRIPLKELVMRWVRPKVGRLPRRKVIALSPGDDPTING